MPDLFDSRHVKCGARCLWMDFTQAGTTLLALQEVESCCSTCRVRSPQEFFSTIAAFMPHFLCFEFDNPDPPGMDSLRQARCQRPDLPVLMITGCHSEAVAIWALRMRLWDLLVKPIDVADLRWQFAMLGTLARGQTDASALAAAADHPLGPHDLWTLPAPGGPQRRLRTQPAVAHVASHFFSTIALNHAAALCGLCTSQFCRVFLHEQGVSFGKYLLRFRIEQACERLGRADARVNEVAYAVGFNDLSYFAWAFKRQVGVCPSRYRQSLQSQTTAGSS